MDTIKFYRGEENGLVVEKQDFHESIFIEQYVKAIQQIAHVVSHPTKDVPNIVSFCGDRGEGKTSCMTSIIEMLKNKDSQNVTDFFEEQGCDNILHRNIEILDMIDPAFFDEEHNLLQLMLGQMFQKFKSKFETPENNEINQSAADNLTVAFEKAKRCLTQIKQPRERIYDPIEELSALAAAQDLRTSIDELVASYLKYFQPQQNDETPILVICIDDIDLNIDGAYKMVEQIRKYLTSPQLLLLISLNVDQLINVISNYLDNRSAPGHTMDTEAMASKYVTKLIPLTNRVIMPKIYDICDTKLQIYEKHGDDNYVSYNSVKEAVVRLIYNKTRYLFYNSKGGVSPIVPNNLRSLRHLLGLLLEMKNFQDNDVDSSNKHVFKAYFYQTWVHQLRSSDQDFVNKLVTGDDVTIINKMVVSKLSNYIEACADESQISDIVIPANYSYNVSVGDVFALVYYLERSNVSEDVRLLLFFIKSFYSIRLYEYYDVITEVDGELYPIMQEDGEVYKVDSWLKRTNLMQRFVNGSYFTYLPDDILPKAMNGTICRDMKLYNARLLREFVSKNLKNEMARYNQLPDAEKHDFEIRFRVMEFFALTAKRSIAQKKADKFDRLRRDYAEPFHLTDFNIGTGYVVFDVLAPFYNVLNLKYAYSRFSYLRGTDKNDDFYQFAYAHKWSLLNQMIKYVYLKEYNEQNPQETKTIDNIGDIPENLLEKQLFRLMSNAVIRNGEVLSSIMESILSRRINMHNVKSHRVVLSRFYSDIINSEMRTYKNEDTEKPYIIRFDFLKAIIDLLKEERTDVLIQIYESGLESQQTTDEDVLMEFQKFFSSGFKTKKGTAILADFEKIYPERISQMLPTLKNMFPDASRIYPREYIIGQLKRDFYNLTGLVKSTEYYEEDEM